MVALFHRHDAEVPTAKACTSHAIYTVVTDDMAEHHVCAPHTYMLMGQLIGEHPHYAGADPAPGTPCAYVEVSW
ncbi:hypothetical protein [Glycomyces sp. NPDC021274]|uniref:hypothetical protein n=1 Tax=Glycomyces sp. NPDC021274 TaxID=3155120 RepID=UPI0033CF04B5